MSKPTVAELIAVLQKFPPESTVFTFSEGGYYESGLAVNVPDPTVKYTGVRTVDVFDSNGDIINA